MNNKGFVEHLAGKVGAETAQMQQFVDSFIESVADALCDGKVVSIQGFGNFEKKEKAERKIYNPASKEFKVVPCKVVANFKMSPVLKDKINTP